MNGFGKILHLPQNIFFCIKGRIDGFRFFAQNTVTPANFGNGRKGQIAVGPVYRYRHHAFPAVRHFRCGSGDAWFRTVAQIGGFFLYSQYTAFVIRREQHFSCSLFHNKAAPVQFTAFLRFYAAAVR